jgi:2-polyprenyl-6-hydroxyphenyl methylase/3-demethylubiquinone-9 3-methyltransferase
MIDDTLIKYAVGFQSTYKPGACEVCGGKTQTLDVLDFSRHCERVPHRRGVSGIPVYYERCVDCEFVFTRFFDAFTPRMWTDYIYNPEYDEIDPDYISKRPHQNAGYAPRALAKFWKPGSKGCDFGGGNGLFARLMSNSGMAFTSIDPYGTNQGHDTGQRYQAITAFEVLEHVVDPVSTLRSITNLGDPDGFFVLASTFAVPKTVRPGQLATWWYAAPRNGHVSLYSTGAFKVLAHQNGLTYLEVTPKTHLFGHNADLKALRRAIRIAKVVERLTRPFRSQPRDQATVGLTAAGQQG